MKRRTNKKKRKGSDIKATTKVDISYSPFYIALLFMLSNLVRIIFQDPPTLPPTDIDGTYSVYGIDINVKKGVYMWDNKPQKLLNTDPISFEWPDGTRQTLQEDMGDKIQWEARTPNGELKTIYWIRKEGTTEDPEDPPANPDPPPSKTSQIMGSIAGSIVYLGIIFFLCKSGHTTWAWIMAFGGVILAVLLILLIGVGLAMS